MTALTTIRKPQITRLLPALLAVVASTAAPVEASATYTDTALNTYAQDLDYLQQHTDVIELQHPDSDARLCLVPAWQGRVMTSAASPEGISYGWLNYELIEKGVPAEEERQGLDAHILVFGGEERFWIGPEGGQFSSYFAPGSPFDFENWFVPSFIDTDPWEVVSRSTSRVSLRHRVDVRNWSGHTWQIQVDRDVVLLSEDELETALGDDLPAAVKAVAHETVNTLTNRGEQAWDETTGMPSIWVLGMMKHGPETTVVIPFETQGQDLGVAVTDDYFGKVPAERLVVDEATGVLYFSADGKYRSKIGISPQRSKGVAGSWDARHGVLTIVQYNLPEASRSQYVNSLWELQDEPFSGDAINSYNDGPVGDGQLGPFYEIETSSPALGLAPGAGYTHTHRTIHLEGSAADLDAVARRWLGASLATIEAALR
jgi:hypothetical protein